MKAGMTGLGRSAAIKANDNNAKPWRSLGPFCGHCILTIVFFCLQAFHVRLSSICKKGKKVKIVLNQRICFKTAHSACTSKSTVEKVKFYQILLTIIDNEYREHIILHVTALCLPLLFSLSSESECVLNVVGAWYKTFSSPPDSIVLLRKGLFVYSELV